MSMIDIVIRRVTSATPRTLRPRKRHTSRSCSCRSETDIDPTFGGVVISKGPSTAASPPIPPLPPWPPHPPPPPPLGGAPPQQPPAPPRKPADPRVPLLDRVRVSLGELRELVVVPLGVIVGLHDAPAVGEGHEVRTDRNGAVPVARQLEVALDRVGHQAHHIAEGGDLALGSLGPRRHRVGCATDLVPLLQHDGAGTLLGEVGGRHEPVVATSDHDRVVPAGVHAGEDRPPAPGRGSRVRRSGGRARDTSRPQAPRPRRSAAPRRRSPLRPAPRARRRPRRSTPRPGRGAPGAGAATASTRSPPRAPSLRRSDRSAAVRRARAQGRPTGTRSRDRARARPRTPPSRGSGRRRASGAA